MWTKDNISAKIIESSHEGIMVTSKDGFIQFVNPAFTKITGYLPHEAIGNTPRLLKSGKHDKDFYEVMWKSIANSGEWSGHIWNKRKNGEFYLQWMTLSSLKDDEGQVTGYATIFSDVTENYEAQQKLQEDLIIAKNVQRSALSDPIDNDAIQVMGKYIASEQLAGDMYTWHQLSSDEYAVLIMDVMGHGVASSLVSMSILSFFQRLIKEVTNPEDVIVELNKYINHLFKERNSRLPYYFSAIYLLINTTKQEIKYVNAGHSPGLLLQQDEIIQLDSTATCVGLLPFLEVENSVIHYENRARLLLFSDGLIERPTRKIQEGIELVKGQLMQYQDLGNEELLDQLLKDNDIESTDDDISIIAITILEKS